MSLKTYSSHHGPETRLELLRRPQKYGAQLGEQHLTGIGKTTPTRLNPSCALGAIKPA
jgi:hypothetical protein